MKDDDYYDVIYENVVSILKRKDHSDIVIPKTLFLWNLLTIAKCGNDYSTKEQRLMKSIVRLLKVDKVILQEMEFAYDSMMELEDANVTDKEARKQIKERKKVIMKSIQQLTRDQEV